MRDHVTGLDLFCRILDRLEELCEMNIVQLRTIADTDGFKTPAKVKWGRGACLVEILDVEFSDEFIDQRLS
jgi:hypothetical protein